MFQIPEPFRTKINELGLLMRWANLQDSQGSDTNRPMLAGREFYGKLSKAMYFLIFQLVGNAIGNACCGDIDWESRNSPADDVRYRILNVVDELVSSGMSKYQIMNGVHPDFSAELSWLIDELEAKIRPIYEFYETT